jgi:hypothetical protein
MDAVLVLAYYPIKVSTTGGQVCHLFFSFLLMDPVFSIHLFMAIFNTFFSFYLTNDESVKQSTSEDGLIFFLQSDDFCWEVATFERDLRRDLSALKCGSDKIDALSRVF